MIEQFKALMHEHFPDYDLSINECDDQSFLDSEVNAMWMIYKVCNAWQAIETAPKDGTNIIVSAIAFNSQYVGEVHFRNGKWYCCANDGELSNDILDDYIGWFQNPTHWRPLPIPPLTTEGGV
ncbi:MAG TPA: DUF551 domain-containing protein [Lacibacter sp.]|nr:DUF551 domain-containing protein [Lacibacter sp.]